jgi:hypothetical protein
MYNHFMRSRMLWAFIFRKRRANFFIGIGCFLTSFAVFAIWSHHNGHFSQELSTWNFWEPITTIGLLGVAILLWFGEASQDSENALPKKVTVVFLYPKIQNGGNGAEKIAILCEKAYLAGEDDLRNWSQQLGAQISGDGRLKFSPFIRQYPGRIEAMDGGKQFKHYWMVFQLTATPTPDFKDSDKAVAAKKNAEITQALESAKTLRWHQGNAETDPEMSELWNLEEEGGIPVCRKVDATVSSLQQTPKC